MLSVIRSLNARNMKLADVHCQLWEVYGEHAMSDSMVRRWVRHLQGMRPVALTYTNCLFIHHNTATLNLVH
jgi:hypothetical protein